MTDQTAGKNRPFHWKEKLLLVCALLMGLLLIFLIPPFDSPDELTHFQNVWAIGHGQAFTEEYWVEGKLSLPSGFAPLMREYPVRLIGLSNQNKCSWSDLLRQSAEYVPTGKIMSVEGRIFSLGYLFSALGMALGSAVGSLFGIGWLHSPYIQMLLGRFANWIFFVVVLRAVFRKVQPFRRTLFLLAFMPMTLFLGATLNYDAVLIPVSLYLFASILSLSESGSGQISGPEYIRLVLCSLFICGVKAPYACLMLLFLILPRDKSDLRDHGSTRRGMMILLFAFFGLVLSSVPYLVPEGGAVGYSAEQSSWLLSHPFALPGIILKTLWRDAASLVISFWGCFGWLDVHVPKICLLVGWIVLLIVAVFECCTFPSPVQKRKRLPGLIATVLIYCIFCTLQYISHVPKVNGSVIGGDYSVGFQGRYLIPCFLPFLLTFANDSLNRKKAEMIPLWGRRLTVVSVVWGVCCYLITVFTLLTRYWI